VGVEVTDVGRRQARVLEGELHAPDGAFATGRRCRDVVGVGVATVTGDGAVDAGAPGGGPVPALEHDEAGALAHHEAVAVLVEGSRGVGRVVPAAAERAHPAEGGQPDRSDRRL